MHLIKAGDRVGASEAALLGKLGVKPFKYGLEIFKVYEGGSLFDAAVLDITDDDMAGSAAAALANVAALSLATDYPTLASIPHSVINGYKNALAIAVETDYSFPLADKVRPTAAGGAGAAGGRCTRACQQAALPLRCLLHAPAPSQPAALPPPPPPQLPPPAAPTAAPTPPGQGLPGRPQRLCRGCCARGWRRRRRRRCRARQGGARGGGGGGHGLLPVRLSAAHARAMQGCQRARKPCKVAAPPRGCRRCCAPAVAVVARAEAVRCVALA